MLLQCMHNNSTCVSSQSEEKEGEVVHLQGQLLETNTKVTQMDGEWCSRTLFKAKNNRVVALQTS